MQQLPLRVRLGDHARFDSFVPGANVEVRDLLARPGDPRVLWLWGRAGTGKTHLLQASCAAAGERGEPTTYIDLARAPSSAILDGCGQLALVALDNVDAVVAAPEWNVAIFGLYLALHEAHGRLVVASQAPPATLAFSLPDLRSRLLAASVHQLTELDEPGQREALQRRAEARGLELSEEAATYLIHRLPRDGHSLFDALDRLDQASLVAQRRLTIPFLREQLEADRGDDG